MIDLHRTSLPLQIHLINPISYGLHLRSFIYIKGVSWHIYSCMHTLFITQGTSHLDPGSLLSPFLLRDMVQRSETGPFLQPRYKSCFSVPLGFTNIEYFHFPKNPSRVSCPGCALLTSASFHPGAVSAFNQHLSISSSPP